MATGDYYCWLAENLYKSYKIFSKNTLPFYVVTDYKGQQYFKNKHVFDGIEIIKQPSYSYLDKLQIYNLIPLEFEEIIFIDADCFVCGDISFLFDLFEKNNSDMSCLGYWDRIGKTTGSYDYTNYFNETAIKKFNLKQYIQLEGGLYYFKRSASTSSLISFVVSELEPHYDEYGLARQSKRKSDECLFNVAMSVFHMNPLGNRDRSIMDYVYRCNMYGYHYKYHKADFNSEGRFCVKSCTIDNQIFKREILIPHWTTDFSKTIAYYKASCMISCKYHNYGKIKTQSVTFIKTFIYIVHHSILRILNKFKYLIK